MPTGKGMGYHLLASKSRNREKQYIAATINRKMRIRRKNESIENKIRNMHGRDKKEEHEGERKCRVSKVVLQARFGCK
jgi:hypothetical protein